MSIKQRHIVGTIVSTVTIIAFGIGEYWFGLSFGVLSAIIWNIIGYTDGKEQAKETVQAGLGYIVAIEDIHGDREIWFFKERSSVDGMIESWSENPAAKRLLVGIVMEDQTTVTTVSTRNLLD